MKSSYLHLYPRRFVSLVLTVCLLFMVVGSAFAQDLGQTYTSPDGSLSFNYPDGWVTQELLPGFLFVASSEDALARVNGESEEDGLLPGDVVYYIIGPTAAKAAFDADPAASAMENLVLLSASLGDSSDSENPTTVGEPAELTIGNFPAARATITSADLDGLIVVFKPTDDSVIVTLLATPVGETESAEPQFRAVLETIQYTAPAPPEPVEVGDLVVSFASADGRLTVQMPEGWVGRESYGDYELANSQATIDKYEEEFTVDPGNVLVTLITPDTLSDTYEAPTDDPQAALVKLAEYWGFEGDIVPVDVSRDGLTAFSITSTDLFGYSYFLTFVLNNEVFALRVTSAFGDDPSIWQDVLIAIAQTISYRTFTAPEAAATINWRVLPDANTDFAFVVISQVELGADGTLYGMDLSSGSVYTIAPDGTLTTVLSAVNFTASTYSSDFAVAPDGTFWVTDSSDYSVHHFGADGNEIGTIPGDPENPAYTTLIEFGPDGNLYVLDGVKNPNDEYVTDSRIRAFDAAGTQLKEIILDGGDASSPTEFTISPDGKFYIIGYSAMIVADLEGNLVSTPAILRPALPAQIEFAADGAPILSFEVTDYSTDTPVTYRSVVKYGPDGLPVAAFGTAAVDTSAVPMPEGELVRVNDFVALPDGSVVISDGYYPSQQLVSVTFP